MKGGGESWGDHILVKKGGQSVGEMQLRENLITGMEGPSPLSKFETFVMGLLSLPTSPSNCHA